MLGLPESTEVRQRINKSAIYRKFQLDNSQQVKFDEDVSSLVIVNEVSSQTIKIPGSDENAFFVLEVQLKHQNYDKKNIEGLSKLIDQNLLLVLRYEDFARLAVFKTVLHESEWKPVEEYSIKLLGLSFDEIWQSIICSVGEIEIENDNTLSQQIDLNIQKEKLRKEIDKLEKLARKENQPKKKFELVSQKRKLEKELNSL